MKIDRVGISTKVINPCGTFAKNMESFEIYIGCSFKKVFQSDAQEAIGVGGYGVVITSQGKIVKELSAGYTNTKESRINLHALCNIFNAIDFTGLINVYLPNGYIEDTITQKRFDKWINDGSIASRPNNDLWLKFYPLLKEIMSDITFRRLLGVKNTWQARRAKDLSRSAFVKEDKQVDMQKPSQTQPTLFD